MLAIKKSNKGKFRVYHHDCNRVSILIISLSTACCLLPFVFTGCTKMDKEANAVQTINNGTAPAYGDTLVEGTIGEPSILIPMLAGDASSHDVAGLIINGLVKYDKDLTLVGNLADRWDGMDKKD